MKKVATSATSAPRRLALGKRSGLLVWLAVGGIGIPACMPGGETGGSGTGGKTQPGTGGAVQPGTGGSTVGTGGSDGTGSGGSDGSGGSTGSGGATTGTGGQTGTGGATGGRNGSGGGPGGGGRMGTGGSVGTGGTVGTGGAVGTGGSGGTPPTGGAVKFLPNIKVSDGSGMETSIAAGPNGAVLVSWVDYRSGTTCGFAASADGGTTFKKNVILKPMGGSITGDSVAGVDGAGTLYAVCQDYGTSQVRVMTSTDKGDTWSAVVSAQSSPDKPWVGGSPSKPGTVFISWLGSGAGVKRSTDSGKTWGAVHKLESLNHGTTLSVGMNDYVHLAWTPNGGNIRYKRSKDLGETWEAIRTIGQTGTFAWGNAGSRQNPILGGGSDISGKYVAIVWAATYTGGEGDEDIWFIYSKDGGDTWTTPKKINDNPNKSRQWQAWGGVDSLGRVHAVWSDTRNGKLDTYYARSLADPTQGFEKNIKVNETSGNIPGNTLDYKGLAIYGNDVYVSFPDTRMGGVSVWFAKAPGAAGP